MWDAGGSQRSEERGAKVMIPIHFPGIRRRSKAQSSIDGREIDSSWHGIYPTQRAERLTFSMLNTSTLVNAYKSSARLICTFLSSPALTMPTSLSQHTLNTLTPSPWLFAGPLTPCLLIVYTLSPAMPSPT
jgi:hypothetical protein